MEEKHIEIFQRDINTITPYENNPRINERAVEAVAASIKEFGWQQPIVVDKNGVIIAGHTRYKAALLLGLKTVPVTVADLTEEQATAYRIADNKTADLSEWDYEKLSDEISGITGIDMRDFGFTDVDFASFGGDFDASDIADEPETSADLDGVQSAQKGKQKRVIITYRTDEEREYLEQLFGVKELKEAYNFKDIKTVKEGAADETD